MKKLLIVLSIVIASLVAVVLLALGAVQLALKPDNGNRLLDKYLPQFLNAHAQYDSLDLNIFTTWPYVQLRLDGVLVKTLAFEEPDTLLAVKSLGAMVNAGEFLTSGEIKVSYVNIDNPYIKAQKKDSIYSWDVIEPSEEVDTTATEMPVIVADLLSIKNARVVFRDMDSHFMAEIDSLDLKADDIEILPALMKCYAEAGVSTLFYNDSVANRRCSVNDFSLKLNAFRDDKVTDLLLFNAKSDDICLKDSMFNVERTSLDMFVRATADSLYEKFIVDTLGVRVDETTLTLNGGVTPDFGDTLAIGVDNFNLMFNCPSIWRLRTFAPSQIAKHINKLVFDGAVNLKANANGLYKGDNLPVVKASVKLSNINGGVKAYTQRIKRIDLDAEGCYNQKNKNATYININRLYAEAVKNSVDVKGWAGYKNGREYVDADLKAALNLKVINELYKFDEKQRMAGTINANINGRCFLDDLKKMNLYQIFTTTEIKGDGIGVLIPSQKLGVYTDSLRIALNTNTYSRAGAMKKYLQSAGSDSLKTIKQHSAQSMRKKESSHTLASKSQTVRYAADDSVLVNLRVGFSSLKMWYKRRVKVESDRFFVSVMADDIEPGKVPRFSTMAGFGGLDITVDDTLKFHAKRMSGSVSIAKNALRPNVPTTSLRFAFDSITTCAGTVCTLLDSTRIKLATTPRVRMARRRGKAHTQEEKIVDLRELVTLFDTLSKSDDPSELFMKRFSNEGTVYVKRLKLKDADFPLRTSVSRLDLEVNDDTIHLNSIKPRLGRSAVTIKGEVTNWRRYLLRNKTLKADFTLTSKRIDLNQIMKAFYVYNQNAEARSANVDSISANIDRNATSLASEGDDTELESDSTAITNLIVLPKNWDFRFRANIDTLKFSKINLADFAGKIRLKNSRLRIKELSTSTEVGRADMNVMYECSVPDSAKATVAIDMDSIQIGDLITYLPELDSIMPMLRSFSGGVECNASAECTIDSLCNINLPSVNAALKLKGDDLVLLDGETFTQIAKLLMFNKKTENKIDSVTAEVVVQNNEVLIYPFMVGMDKYRLGVGGTQNLDMSFNYHIVVLKPAILSAVGLDLYGKDFDHLKFRLTSPKFKGFDVAIASGGTLVKTSKVDVRQMMYDAMLNAIIKEEE